MLKLKKNRKLFYRKFAYKIDIMLAMSRWFRGTYNRANKNLSETRHMLYNHDGWYMYNRSDKPMYEERSNAVSVLEILEKYDFDSFKTRCEYMTLSIYTNNEDLKNELVDTMQKKTEVILHEPDKRALDFLLANQDVIVVEHEPEMKYKVTIRQKGDLPAIATFLEANKGNTQATRTVINSLKRQWYVDNNYFYVKTDAMLSLVSMMFSDSIRRVEKFEVVDKQS